MDLRNPRARRSAPLLRGVTAGLLLATTAACTDESRAASPAPAIGAEAIPARAAAPTTTLQGDTTIAAALAGNAPPHDAPNDSIWDAVSARSITLNGGSISASGGGVEVSSTRATITAPGTYRVRGALADGQIVVNSTVAGTVRLVLDGASITHRSGAPIDVVAADEVVVILARGSANALVDGENYTLRSGTDEPNAALYSTADLTITGSGSLTVTASYNDGIASTDGLVIAGGTITVTAEDDAIRGKDYLIVRGGRITATAGGDGLTSDNEDEPDAGYVYLAGGTVTVNADGDAVQGETDVLVADGTLTLTSGGGSARTVVEGASARGLKANAWLVVAGGTTTIDAADDGLQTNGPLVISGGTLRIASSDDGMHADGPLRIAGGTITITRSYEGIESTAISILGGTVSVVASDDAVNAPVASRSDVGLRVSGGRLLVEHAGADGIDVNGSIEISGGELVLHGPSGRGSGAIDYDGTLQITGGFLAAAGSVRMAQAPGSGPAQPTLLLSSAGGLPAGRMVHIRSAAGEELLSFVPNRASQTVAFSSPALKVGTAYEVYTGGSATGTVLNGLHTGGSYTRGTRLSTFTPTGAVTRVSF